jgi:hypothetical protein
MSRKPLDFLVCQTLMKLGDDESFCLTTISAAGHQRHGFNKCSGKRRKGTVGRESAKAARQVRSKNSCKQDRSRHVLDQFWMAENEKLARLNDRRDTGQ